mmetsp:Transcript_1155/g.2725  ORF Transcript_1155/g.2725 Transcript_1155/m.2725 type:complete len:212 (-) Transcript_1155:253-888(-)
MKFVVPAVVDELELIPREAVADAFEDPQEVVQPAPVRVVPAAVPLPNREHVGEINHLHIGFALQIALLEPVVPHLHLFFGLLAPLVNEEDRGGVEPVQPLLCHHLAQRLQHLDKPLCQHPPPPAPVVEKLGDPVPKLIKLELVAPDLVVHGVLTALDLVRSEPTDPRTHAPRRGLLVFLLAPGLLDSSPIRRRRAHPHLHVKHARPPVPAR